MNYTTKEKSHREVMNSEAYMDVLHCKEPQHPGDTDYMYYYNSWRPLQTFPEDLFPYGYN